MSPVPSARRPRALVLRALGLGDLLTAVPALRGLRRGLPGHELVLLAPAHFAPLVRWAGLADVVVDTIPWRAPPAAFEDAEIAVNLHGRGPQSHRLLLATRPRRLVAYACHGVADGPCWDARRARGHPVVPARRSGRLPRRSRRPRDCLPGPTDRWPCRRRHHSSPGAAAVARRWPVDRWAEVARREHGLGEHVVLTGRGTSWRCARRLLTGRG